MKGDMDNAKNFMQIYEIYPKRLRHCIKANPTDCMAFGRK